MAVTELAERALCTGPLTITERQTFAIKAPLTVRASAWSGALDDRRGVSHAEPCVTEHLIAAVQALAAGLKALPFNADPVRTTLTVEGADHLWALCGHALPLVTALIGGAGSERIAGKVAATIQTEAGEAAVIIDDTEVLRMLWQRPLILNR